MEQATHERLVTVMRRLATGDRAAVFTLYEEFGVAIGAALRRELTRFGRMHVPAEDLDGLVIDACLEIAALARSWDPDRGATPWTWAGRRLTNLVSGHVGIRAEPLSDALLERRGAGSTGCGTSASDPESLTLLERSAARHPDCRLLLDAFDLVSSPRNRDILLEVRLQTSMGDPAPAVTVGRSFGLRPDAIRQVVRRTRGALARLAADEPRFAPLATIPLVA